MLLELEKKILFQLNQIHLAECGLMLAEEIKHLRAEGMTWCNRDFGTTVKGRLIH